MQILRAMICNLLLEILTSVKALCGEIMKPTLPVGNNTHLLVRPVQPEAGEWPFLGSAP